MEENTDVRSAAIRDPPGEQDRRSQICGRYASFSEEISGFPMNQNCDISWDPRRHFFPVLRDSADIDEERRQRGTAHIELHENVEERGTTERNKSNGTSVVFKNTV